MLRRNFFTPYSWLCEILGMSYLITFDWGPPLYARFIHYPSGLSHCATANTLPPTYPCDTYDVSQLTGSYSRGLAV